MTNTDDFDADRAKLNQPMPATANALAASAHLAAAAEQIFDDNRQLRAKVNYAIEYLLRVHGPGVARGYMQVMLGAWRAPAMADEPTIESLQAEIEAASRILISALDTPDGRAGRHGRTSLIELANKAVERAVIAETQLAEDAADRKRWEEQLFSDNLRIAHLELNAELVVEHVLRAAGDEHAATLELIDAEFDEYPDGGTNREIAIWNHLDNIDGSRVNVRYRDRKWQSTRAMLRAARQRIRELETKLADRTPA